MPMKDNMFTNNKLLTAFHIHGYGRMELSMLYSPHVSPETAWRRLKRSIHRYPGLLDALRAIGYTPKCRSFTSAQVKKIVECIGEP